MAFNEYEYAPHMPQTTYAPRLCDVLNYGYDLKLDAYPIFDEGYRAELNQKIVNHFYTREIAYETPSLFIMRLNVKMVEHMPQINRVYELINERDPFRTAYTKQSSWAQAENTNESSGTSSSDAESRAYNSNAPQVAMVGKDEVNYYDTGAVNTAENSGTTSDTSKGTSKSTQGSESEQSNATVADLIANWYDGYNNADLMVFDALEPCFCQLFQSGYNMW